MTAEMVAPAWMHTQISAEQYASWSEEQCAGIEIVDGMVVVSPTASKRHNRLARILSTGASNRPSPGSRSCTPTFSTPPPRLTGTARCSPAP